MGGGEPRPRLACLAVISHDRSDILFLPVSQYTSNRPGPPPSSLACPSCSCGQLPLRKASKPKAEGRIVSNLEGIGEELKPEMSSLIQHLNLTYESAGSSPAPASEQALGTTSLESCCFVALGIVRATCTLCRPRPVNGWRRLGDWAGKGCAPTTSVHFLLSGA